MRLLLPLPLAVVSLVLPFAAFGQQASLSPALSRPLPPDTVIAVWLFGTPQSTITQMADAARQVGGRVRRESRWLHAVSAELSGEAIARARARPEFRRLQPVARFVGGPLPPVTPVAAAAPPLFRTPPLDSLYGASGMPFRRLNLFPLVQAGLRGSGVRIAILDTGFETGRSIFASTMVIAQRDFVFNDSVVRNEANDATGASDHGTSTWSLLAANAPGTMVGIAPDAQYILAKTEDIRSETRVEEDNYVAALEWADSLGAKVVSSSLGYLIFDNGFRYTPDQLNGDVAVTSVAAEVAAQRGITIVTAMGNEGPAPQTLDTPADADSIISVGAVDSLGNLASFSSRGPTADGRIKPDVTAPGVAVFIATPVGFARGSGTSFSAPIVAGAVALMKQAHPAMGPIEIRDALRNAGSNARTPDANRGWGTPDVALATNPGTAPPLALLFQNFPNPFPDRASGQAFTCIWFDVATPGTVRLDILDLRGHVVKNLVPGNAFSGQLASGRYGRAGLGATTGCDPDLRWNGDTTDGSLAPQGVYLMRLATPEGLFFKRVVFLGPS